MNSLSETVSVTIPVLEGASNWNTWHPKFQHVTRAINPIYWEIFIGNYTAPVAFEHTPQIAIDAIAAKHNISPNGLTKKAFGEYQELNAAIGKQARSQNHTSLTSWKTFEAEARAYLDFALARQPFLQVKHTFHAREAYLKLEALYCKALPKPISGAWKEWLELRYQRTPPAAFVSRFKSALCNLRAQGMRLSTDVELTQFKFAIAQRLGCKSFLANLHCDTADKDCMEYVYSNFIRDQRHSDMCYPRQQ